MKKILCPLLCLLLAAVVLLGLSACGNGAESDTTQQTAQTENSVTTTGHDYASEIPNTKYEYDFVIASTFANDTKYTSNLIVTEEMTGDLIGDAMFRRAEKIRDQLHVNLIVEDVTYTQINNTYKAGDRPYDLGSANLSNIMTCVNTGAAVNLYDVSTANLDKPWWDQNANQKFRIGDKLYYTFSDFFITGIDNSRAVYFNKEMANNLGLGNLYSLLNDNAWTIEKMAQLSVSAKDDSDGNGKITVADTIGISARSVTLYEAMLSACNAELVKQSESGIPYFCPFDESEFFVDVYNKLLDLFGSTDIYYPCTAANARVMFQEGRALFTVDTMCFCSLMRQNSAINFGIMPMPKYNADQQTYMHVSPAPHAFFLIPGDEETLEKDGVILNAASFYSSTYYSQDAVMPCYFQLALQSKSATDNESIVSLQIVHDNISYVIKIVGTDFSGGIYDQFDANNREISGFLTRYEASEKTKLQNVLDSLGVAQ